MSTSTLKSALNQKTKQHEGLLQEEMREEIKQQLGGITETLKKDCLNELNSTLTSINNLTKNMRQIQKSMQLELQEKNLEVKRRRTMFKRWTGLTWAAMGGVLIATLFALIFMGISIGQLAKVANDPETYEMMAKIDLKPCGAEKELICAQLDSNYKTRDGIAVIQQK